MSEEEFNLSEKIKVSLDGEVLLFEFKDVKKFIRLLKEVFQLKAEVIVSGSEVIEMIDKLAGEKLK